MSVKMDYAEQVRFDAILQTRVLSDEDVLFLSRKLEPASKTRWRKREKRDALIRKARQFFPHPEVTLAAKAMASALNRLHCSQPASTQDEKAALLCEVLDLSGAPLGWSSIYQIFQRV